MKVQRFNKETQQANATGVINGAFAQIIIPSHGTIHTVSLMVQKADGTNLTQAEILANIGKINLHRDSDNFQKSDAIFQAYLLKQFCDKNIVDAPDGLILFQFSRPELFDVVQRELTSLGMKDVGEFKIEVEIIGALAGKIEVYTDKDDVEQNFGAHIRVERSVRQAVGTGEEQISNMNYKTANAGLLAMHVHMTSGALTHTEFIKNEDVVKDKTPVDLTDFKNNCRGFTEQDNFVSLRFDRGRNAGGFLPLKDVYNYRQNFWWGTAPATGYTVYQVKIAGVGA